MADRSEPPPVRDSQVPGGEPEIDRVKLWHAWTRNAETQRAVLRRSTVVGVLAVAATLLQVGVAWQVLQRMDAVAADAAREIEEMKGLLRTALSATTAVQAVEIEERAAEVDALFAPEPEPEKQAAPGTVAYQPEAAREVLAKVRRKAGAIAGALRKEPGGFDAVSGAMAEPAPEEAPPPPSQVFLEKRQAAQEQVEAALDALAEPPAAK